MLNFLWEAKVLKKHIYTDMLCTHIHIYGHTIYTHIHMYTHVYAYYKCIYAWPSVQHPLRNWMQPKATRASLEAELSQASFRMRRQPGWLLTHNLTRDFEPQEPRTAASRFPTLRNQDDKCLLFEALYFWGNLLRDKTSDEFRYIRWVQV